MNKNEEQRISRFISLILRHKPEIINVTLEREGWCPVDKILKECKITIDELTCIVNNDNKGRYSFNEDKTKIRANQGHSVEGVNLTFKELTPPSVLYHGTANKYLVSILSTGLEKRTRQYVHLSEDLETASNVGKRHGTLVVLKINAKKMYNDGYKFYLSDNGVWLCDCVPVKYINVL